VWTTTGGRETATLAENVVGAGWVHLAFTYDGQTWRAFVNGIQSQTGATPGFLLGNVEPIAIGSDGAGGSWFDGALDELTLYPYALSAEQLASHAALRSSAGVGSQVLTYNLTANTSGVLRQAALTVQDQALPVAQSAVGEIAITAIITPRPNSLGWNRTNVTVAFACATLSGATATCPESIQITEDGVHEISRTLTDSLGRSATTTLTLKVDQTAPSLAVGSPMLGEIVPAGPIDIEGSTSDLLSTVAVTCGGATGAVSGSQFSCSVNVPPGGLAVPVVARDEAGNVRSTLVEIVTAGGPGPEPTALRISPQRATMLVGQERTFSVRDDLGRIPPNVAWTVDAPALASVTMEPVPIVTAIAPGEVTLTASWAGLTATTQLTVLGATTVPVGTVLWTTSPIAGTTGEVIHADGPEGTRIYTVESASSVDVVRAFESDGSEAWSASAGGRVAQISATPEGGAVVAIADTDAGTSLIRNFGLDGRPADSPGGTSVSGFAIHPDGVLYRVEATSSGWNLVGVDIGSGRGRSAPLPVGEARSCTGGNLEHPEGCTSVPTTFAFGTPTVVWDGSVVLPVVTGLSTAIAVDYLDHTRRFEPKLALLFLRPDGSTVVREHPLGVGLSGGPGGSTGVLDVAPFKAIPDGQGGVLVAFARGIVTDTYRWRTSLARFDSEGVFTGQAGIVGHWWADLILGTDRVLAVTYGSEPGEPQRKKHVTYLTTTGVSTGWDNLTGRSVSNVAAAEGGGFLMNYSDGEIVGPTPGYEQLHLTKASHLGEGNWIGLEPQNASGNSLVGLSNLTSVAGPTFALADTRWPIANGRWFGNSPWPRPLLKSRLEEIAVAEGVSTWEEKVISPWHFNRKVGGAFQGFATWSFGPWPTNTDKLDSPLRHAATDGYVGKVIPDMLLAHEAWQKWWGPLGTNILYPRSSLFEVKAVTGTIRLDHSNFQTLGFIDAATRTAWGLARPVGHYVPLTYITVADTYIGLDVLGAALPLKVQIRHVKVAEVLERRLQNQRSRSYNIGWRDRYPLGGATKELPSGRVGRLTQRPESTPPDDPDPPRLWP
jgi:hypothetical protein